MLIDGRSIVFGLGGRISKPEISRLFNNLDVLILKQLNIANTHKHIHRKNKKIIKLVSEHKTADTFAFYNFVRHIFSLSCTFLLCP